MRQPRRLRRRQDLAKRLVERRQDGRRSCWVFDCNAPSGNASGEGLGRFCRKHLEHYRRHGDPLKGSYKAAEIAPYSRAATSWLTSNADDRYVKNAVQRIEALLKKAGHSIPPRNLRGVPPQDKVRSRWARLREREVAPAAIVSAILGVAMTHFSDPFKAKKEHRQVQVGKALNRMAGGEVRRWKKTPDSPFAPNLTLRWFPASEGLVLRVLGEQAEEATEFLIQDRMDQLLRYSTEMRSAKAAKALTSLPFPDA